MALFSSSPTNRPSTPEMVGYQPPAYALTPEEVADIRASLRQIVAQVENVIVGKREVLELCALSLLAQGHVLLEDVPGVGKTMLAKAFARALGGEFKRIQFTPDLLPGDVTGLSIYEAQNGEFLWTPGPVFANILLADEINRATPKTQSALLEAMEEAQVTVDGVTRPLPQPFFAIATQNPVEYRGTYPLPEAQMDRFLMRLSLGYPRRDEEIEMVNRHVQAGAVAHVGNSTGQEPQTTSGQAGSLLDSVQAATSPAQMRAFQAGRMRVAVSPAICAYLIDLARATRSDARVALGASPRGVLALQRAAQAAAILEGRNFVLPDDIKKLAPFVWSHRLILHGDGESGTAREVVQSALDSVAVGL